MTATTKPPLSYKGLLSWKPLRTLSYLTCSRKERGQSCWIRLGLCIQRLSESFSQMLVWKGIVLTTRWDTEFVITRESIQEFLEIRPPLQSITVQYEDRLDSITEMVLTLDGTLKKNSMNTIPFSSEMRTLAYVMIHNLYPVTNLMTLSAPRIIFLYDLFTHKEIDICGHIFHLLKKSIAK